MHTSRRAFLRFTGAAAAGLTVSQSITAQAAAPAGSAGTSPVRPTPDEALRLLQEGNARFVAGRASRPCHTPADFKAHVDGQYPIAMIIGCADARVPPEILFDQGVGDLFVVRVAGNVVTGTGVAIKGTIEYAIAELATPLIVVLGHGNCGAVKAAIKHIDAHDSLPGALNGLVDLIKPAVLQVRDKPGDKLDNAIRANVEDGVMRLKTLEPIVAPAVRLGKAKVVGATYDLRSGKVMMLG